MDFGFSGAFKCDSRRAQMFRRLVLDGLRCRIRQSLNVHSLMLTERPSDEDHVIQLKAPEQANKWTIIGDCFVNCCFHVQERTVRLKLLFFHLFQFGLEWFCLNSAP